MNDWLTPDQEREARGGNVVVALVVICAIIVMMAGCEVSVKKSSTVPPVPAATAKFIKIPWHPSPPVTNIILTWEPRYMTNADGKMTYSNEVTVVVRGIDLTVPREVWSECFVGHTNQCVLPIIGNCGFYGAYNKLATNE